MANTIRSSTPSFFLPSKPWVSRIFSGTGVRILLFRGKKLVPDRELYIEAENMLMLCWPHHVSQNLCYVCLIVLHEFLIVVKIIILIPSKLAKTVGQDEANISAQIIFSARLLILLQLLETIAGIITQRSGLVNQFAQCMLSTFGQREIRGGLDHIRNIISFHVTSTGLRSSCSMGPVAFCCFTFACKSIVPFANEVWHLRSSLSSSFRILGITVTNFCKKT